MAPFRRQAIIWNNDCYFTDAYMRHSIGLNELNHRGRVTQVYVGRYTRPALVQVITCPLSGTKPVS